MPEIENTTSDTSAPHFEKEITVTVDSKIVNSEFDKAVRSAQQKAQRPGFRPGKMPRDMVLNFYKGQIKQQVIESLVEKSFDNACKEHALVPVSQPKLKPLSDVEESKPFQYQANFQVMPEIKIENYENINVEILEHTFEASDIDQELEHLRENFATFNEPKDREIIGENDLVNADSDVFVEGEKNENYSHKDYAVPLFAPNVPDDLKKSLIGKKIGDEVSVDYDMPSEHQDEALKGKKCKLHLTIKSFKERVLPKLDDDFAKDFSEKFENLDALKDSIKTRFELTKMRRDEYFKQDALSKALVENNPFDVPSALVERMATSLISRELKNMPEKSAQEVVKNHWKEMWESVQDRALFRVKVELILDHLIKKLEIKASDEEVEAKIDGNKEFKPEDARYTIQVEKLMNAILKKANATTKKVELFKQG